MRMIGRPIPAGSCSSSGVPLVDDLLEVIRERLGEALRNALGLLHAVLEIVTPGDDLVAGSLALAELGEGGFELHGCVLVLLALEQQIAHLLVGFGEVGLRTEGRLESLA